MPEPPDSPSPAPSPSSPSGASLRGRLLVATPGLADPNFDRTVVLLLEHDPDGALGVVLNRQTETPVREVLPSWHDLSSEPPVVFFGGPVDPTAAICLASTRPGVVNPAIQTVSPTLGIADLDSDPLLLSADVAYVRVFAGYSGWGGGQLEAEIEAGGWFVADSLPGDAFTASPTTTWRTVLRRQGGRVALFSTYPEDVGQN